MGDFLIEAVIFDMDGVMLDTQRVWDEAILECVTRNGFVMPEGFIDSLHGTSDDSALVIVTDWLGSQEKAIQLIKEVWVEGEKRLETEIYKKPGLDELLAWLKEHGIEMAVASGSKMKWIEHHLKEAEVSDYFDVLVSGFDVEHSKPAPDVFLAAAEKLGVEPGRAIVLEDSPNGIQAAMAGGFIPIMVPDIDQPDDETRALCWAVCETLADVIPLLEREL